MMWVHLFRFMLRAAVAGVLGWIIAPVFLNTVQLDLAIFCTAALSGTLGPTLVDMAENAFRTVRSKIDV